MIVQEVNDSKQESHELRGVYDAEVKAAERVIASLSETVLPILESLETHYYRSTTTWGFETPKRSPDEDQPVETSSASAAAANAQVSMSDD